MNDDSQAIAMLSQQKEMLFSGYSLTYDSTDQL